jgi:hypothetical protein
LACFKFKFPVAPKQKKERLPPLGALLQKPSTALIIIPGGEARRDLSHRILGPTHEKNIGIVSKFSVLVVLKGFLNPYTL